MLLELRILQGYLVTVEFFQTVLYIIFTPSIDNIPEQIEKSCSVFFSHAMLGRPEPGPHSLQQVDVIHTC